MRRVIILARFFLDADSMSKLNIGGIETYLHYLVSVIKQCELLPIIIQYSKEDKEVVFNGTKVVGVNVDKLTPEKKVIKLNKKLESMLQENDIILYATENLIIQKYKNVAVSIQHGIGRDIVSKGQLSRLEMLKNTINKARDSYAEQKILSMIDYLVCVDYNYMNWFRTQTHSIGTKYVCIPNFAKTVPFPRKSDGEIVRILFARRLQEYRGTKVFTAVAEKLLNQYPNIEITIAGDGPDEPWMRDRLGGFSNVKFIKYTADESYTVHADKDIAVVPTIGSEGTSLSLLEAMASGCAPVCTDVGGMTNIILNGYNGIMVRSAETEELYEAISELIGKPEYRRNIANNAYKTVNCSFSHERWKNQWIKAINEIIYLQG